MPLVALAEKMHMNYKTAVYNYKELLRRKYINKFTVTMPLHKEITIVAAFIKYLTMKEEARLRADVARFFISDDENPLVSRYLLKASLLGSYDSFFIGAFDSMRKAMKQGIRTYKNTMKGIASDRIVHAGVSEILMGRLPIRSMNVKKEYKEHRSNLASSED